MMGTPIYAETFQDYLDIAVAEDREDQLEELDRMDRDTTPKEKV